MFTLPSRNHAPAQTKVNPEDAAKHIGYSINVCGKVYGGVYLQKSKSTPTLLNIDAAYPNSPFTAIIFDKAKAMFPTAPEVYYNYSLVCITRVLTYPK